MIFETLYRNNTIKAETDQPLNFKICRSSFSYEAAFYAAFYLFFFKRDISEILCLVEGLSLSKLLVSKETIKNQISIWKRSQLLLLIAQGIIIMIGTFVEKLMYTTHTWFNFKFKLLAGAVKTLHSYR